MRERPLAACRPMRTGAASRDGSRPRAVRRECQLSGRSVAHDSVTLNSLQNDWRHQICTINKGRIWDGSACFWHHW
jgi:hypothetical protein